MDLITSRSNSKIKPVRALRRGKKRRESGLFLVEGIRHVGEAVAAASTFTETVAPKITASMAVESIFYAPDLLTSDFARALIRRQAAGGIPCYATTADVFISMAGKQHPQGILAVVRSHPFDLTVIEPVNFPWGVALIAPQDPGNVGTILRTIDAVGASGLILLDGGADPYHPSSVRASMGALFWYPIVTASFADFAQWANAHAYNVIGTSAHGSADYQSVDYRRPLILLMGSERDGLTPEQAALCGRLIRIPMQGRATSLNLAVAAGILLYKTLDCGGQETN